MGHIPLPALAVSEKFRAGHEKNAPALQFTGGFLALSAGLKYLQQFLPPRVAVLKPRFQSPGIVNSGKAPLFFQDKIALKI